MIVRSVSKYARTALAAAAIAVPGAFALAAPAQAAELKIGLREFAPGKGNGYSGCICTPGVFVWSAVYQQLVKIGPSGESQPFLATGWTNVSPTKWRVNIREGINFHNGEQLDADAVVAAYKFLWTEEGAVTSTGKSVGKQIADATKVDAYTVEFTTPGPDPVFPKRIQGVSIVPPKAWADMGIKGFTNNPIGTGPYTVEFGAETATAEAFPGAWKPVTGNVERINWVVLPEGPARAQALLSDQIDVDVSVARDSVGMFEAAGMKTYAKPSTRTLGLSLVSMREGKPVDGPIGDKRVRQALNYAVNKQAIVDQVYGGAGRPATQAAMQGVFGYNQNISGYPYNPEKAKQLLAEAGYPNGDGLELEFRAIMTDASFSLVYQSAVQDINAVGVKADLISQPFAEWIKPWLAGNWEYEGFGIGHDLTATMDAGRAFDTFSSCLKGGGTADEPASAYYCNPDEMPLINQAMVEFDSDKREKMLQDALAVHTENAPIIFLIEFDETMGYNPKIQNFSHVNLWIPYEELRVN